MCSGLFWEPYHRRGWQSRESDPAPLHRFPQALMQTSPEPPGFANTALIFDSPVVKNLPSPHSLIRGQLGEHLPGAQGQIWAFSLSPGLSSPRDPSPVIVMDLFGHVRS